MFDNNGLMEMQERTGADERELNIFCYVAYYPYLNA